MPEYTADAQAVAAVIRGGSTLHPTATTTTVQVAGGKARADAVSGLDGYPWWHATRAELLHRLGPAGAGPRRVPAGPGLGMSEREAGHLRRRIAGLRR